MHNVETCHIMYFGEIIIRVRSDIYMHRELDDRNRVLVGLIIIFALLFFCAYGAWTDRESSAFWIKYIKEPEVQEVVVEEPVEEEPEEVVLNPDMPMIAITFDDGPGKYTDELLSILEENDAKASFFVLGSNVVKYPEVIQRMEQLGFEIGNHTYNHVKLTQYPPEVIQQEVGGTNVALTNVLGHGAELVRPPYGAVNETVRASLAHPFAFWSVDTLDWQLKDPTAIANYILGTAKDGDVVLLHDIYGFTLEAMRTVIPALKAQGYQLVTFSEMMEVHGITMENGQKYFNCY